VHDRHVRQLTGNYGTFQEAALARGALEEGRLDLGQDDGEGQPRQTRPGAKIEQGSGIANLIELERHQRIGQVVVKDGLRALDRGRRELVGYEQPPLAAVNETYVKADAPLHDGDELAFIPPVAGG